MYWTHGSELVTNAWSLPEPNASQVPPGQPRTGQAVPQAVSLQINGVSWYGMEARKCMLGGLDKRPSREYAARDRG